MIKINENNYLNYIDTPWDGNPLGVKANSIIEFKAEDYQKSLFLLSKFEEISNNIEYTSIRIDSRDTHIVKALGTMNFHMTEIAMKVGGVISKLDIDESMFNKFLFTQTQSKKDYEIISKYAVDFFHHGKFHEDPLITRQSANLRNINMVNDLTKKYTTYIGKVGDSILGFMILKEEDTTIDLLLGGIHPNYRHLSYSFWNRVFLEYKTKGFKKFITTISAANIPVINLYNKFNFKFNQSLYGFRKFR